MKKIILSAIVLASSVAFVNAQTPIQDSTAIAQYVVASDNYQEVPLSDLSQTIQDAVKQLAGDAYDVTKVEYAAEQELTRVTLVNKEDKSEKCVILNKDGQEVNDAPAA